MVTTNRMVGEHHRQSYNVLVRFFAFWPLTKGSIHCSMILYWRNGLALKLFGVCFLYCWKLQRKQSTNRKVEVEPKKILGVRILVINIFPTLMQSLMYCWLQRTCIFLVTGLSVALLLQSVMYQSEIRHVIWVLTQLTPIELTNRP